MSSKKNNKLKVVLCWHMHQPEYRDHIKNEYQLPWTYLHTIKDYVDMVAHIENVPGAKAVFNFAPILLEQMSDYANQVEGFLNDSRPINDPLLAALDMPALPVAVEKRLELINACQKANEDKIINRFPAFQRLNGIAKVMSQQPEALAYMEEQFLVDLVVWYHLAWLGESIRLTDKDVKRLIKKGMNFTLQDRRKLLTVISGLLTGVLGRYKALAESGRIELAMSPYGHPIVPLLLDLESTREAMPDAQLPMMPEYPGGEERARWHIQHGIDVFRKYFGFKPQGCWPSEGAMSQETLKLFNEYGFKWAASGEGVYRHSRSLEELDEHNEVIAGGLYSPYNFGELTGPACFFRDDGLSDLIGFTYTGWAAEDAVGDFIQHLENINNACDEDKDHVVSVILDGENAWEYYHENGYAFLSGLYERLAAHPDIDLTTFSEALESGVSVKTLPKCVAGSWVYGNFATWIGDEDKNRGWDMLGKAKTAYDEMRKEGRLSGEKLANIERQLAICEGSDWCWWFGDYNPATSVSDFERLYRLHLANLYQMLGQPPPESLVHAVSHGGGEAEHGGVMQKGINQ